MFLLRLSEPPPVWGVGPQLHFSPPRPQKLFCPIMLVLFCHPNRVVFTRYFLSLSLRFRALWQMTIISAPKASHPTHQGIRHEKKSYLSGARHSPTIFISLLLIFVSFYWGWEYFSVFRRFVKSGSLTAILFTAKMSKHLRSYIISLRKNFIDVGLKFWNIFIGLLYIFSNRFPAPPPFSPEMWREYPFYSNLLFFWRI